jgi:glucose-1-phosphate cytidylyltransferase|tara:strand:+ start:219 stop:362 length:144 start_codon:yes stop_codon:yes gene_type:complete
MNFLMTYGDTVSSIDLKKLINFHKKNKKVATITAVFKYFKKTKSYLS